MFAKIIVPVDPAEPEFSQRSVDDALGLAASVGGAVRLVAVSPVMTSYVQEYLPADVQTEVEREAQDTRAGLARLAGHEAVETVVRLGSVGHEVIEEARVWGADLIVVASHRPKLATYVLGSHAAQIVRHAPCSVLVLRDPPPAA